MKLHCTCMYCKMVEHREVITTQKAGPIFQARIQHQIQNVYSETSTLDYPKSIMYIHTKSTECPGPIQLSR